MDSLTKSCSKCQKDKPLEAFHACSRAPDGRQYWCIECRAEYDRRGRYDLSPLGMGPLEPGAITRLLTHWKPPAMSVTIVQVSTPIREAVSS